MKTIVVHDDAGNILAFAIPVEEFAARIDLEAGPGQRVVYVDSADFGIGKTSFVEHPKGGHAPKLPGIIEDFKIVNGRVVRKEDHSAT